MRNRKTLSILGLFLALVVYLTACTAGSAPATTKPDPIASGAVTPSVLNDTSTSDAVITEAVKTETPHTQSVTEPIPGLTESPAPALTAGDPEPESSSPTPTQNVKSELSATNPETVQLASGEPQLVEFFAFW